MRLSSKEEPKEMQGFILSLYGFQTILPKSNFIDKLSSKECSWIFDGNEIRRRLH